MKAFDVEIERATQQFPNDTSVKFYKGLMLKLTDRKKEGNKVLRSIEFEEGKDNSEFLSDLTYLGMHLYNHGKTVVANAIYQEASRMHLFQSPHQRTLLSMPPRVPSGSSPDHLCKSASHHTSPLLQVLPAKPPHSTKSRPKIRAPPSGPLWSCTSGSFTA